MSARDDFPETRYSPQVRSEVERLLDEIDRLRAQVERDRPVIDAARAIVNQPPSQRVIPDDAWFAYRTRLHAELAQAVAASTPDEVNEEQT